jgi:hypothetical protein
MEKYIVKSGLPDKTRLGDSHRYKTNKGEISLVYPCYSTFNSYEIYCIEGSLFEDIERYKTLEEAESRINGLLL